jgi:hypothetical protein
MVLMAAYILLNRKSVLYHGGTEKTKGIGLVALVSRTVSVDEHKD